MPYLIDGHNLIPHIPGLTLQDLDDEMELVQLLQAFARESGKRIEVYFDNAPPGQAARRPFGPVTAYFVREGRTADAAIRARLKKLGRDAPNWTVVSGDQEVIGAARHTRAKIASPANFAGLLLANTAGGGSREAEGELSDTEVDSWLKLFNENQES